LYLFCDSLERKFFLINLYATPKKNSTTSPYQGDYLILEKYNWFVESNQMDRSVTIITTGSKSTVLELEPGRQLLRIYRSSESSLIVISSDTTFYFGNRKTVQQMMMTESEQIKQISEKISDNIRAAYQSFGTEDYPVTLKSYYQSYMPDLQKECISKIDKNIRILIHNSFMEEQVRLIRKFFANEEIDGILYALRVFFLNPDIRNEKIPQDPATKISKNDEDLDIENNTENDNREIVIIQSFFRMARIKSYKNLHNPDYPLHTQIRNELQKLSDLFDLSLTSQLLRNIINRHNLQDLYSCSKDFIHVLNIEEVRGILGNVRQEQWFPIIRFVVNPNPMETVLAMFELLINLPRITLRVFNNQERRKIPHIVNHVISVCYKHLPTGYTVFAHGHSGKQRFKELDWTIRVITIKGKSMLYQFDEQQFLPLETKPPKLVIEELTGTYIPNIENYISRWILRAVPGSIVSIRLATSYSLVEIRITIRDEKGNILIDTKGDYTILLPVVILKSKHHEVKKANRDVNENAQNAVQKKNYYVEALVLNQSWPLTDAEWTVVNQTKMKIRANQEKKQLGNKISSRSIPLKKDLKQYEDQVLESPYWIFQVVTDARDAIEVHLSYIYYIYTYKIYRIKNLSSTLIVVKCYQKMYIKLLRRLYHTNLYRIDEFLDINSHGTLF